VESGEKQEGSEGDQSDRVPAKERQLGKILTRIRNRQNDAKTIQNEGILRALDLAHRESRARQGADFLGFATQWVNDRSTRGLGELG